MSFGGAIRLFRAWGIDVFLHWSWLLVAIYEIQSRSGEYHSKLWNVLEYITLFAIVLMHEFGHALACRSVGGTANQIVLWPLGGIAFVQPPPRPGAVLWSIVAGPLVNVLLVPVFLVLMMLRGSFAFGPDALHYFNMVWKMNLGLLIFNILPIYPLDGGQILRSLLWFIIGPIRSLQVAAIIGIVGITAFAGLVLIFGAANFLLILIVIFAIMQCLVGLKQAKMLQQKQNEEPIRRPQLRCPSCGQAAPIGPYWRCTCGEPFDTFATGGLCPRCGTQHYVTVCPDCRQPSPMAAWFGQTGGAPIIFNPPRPAFNSGETPQRNPDAPL